MLDPYELVHRPIGPQANRAENLTRMNTRSHIDTLSHKEICAPKSLGDKNMAGA